MKEVWIDTVSSQRKPPSNMWLNSLGCRWRARVPFLINVVLNDLSQSQEAKVLPETLLVFLLPDKRRISSISEKLWATQSARIKRNRCQLLDIAYYAKMKDQLLHISGVAHAALKYITRIAANCTL